MRINTTILIFILLTSVCTAGSAIQQDEVLMLYSQGRSLVLDGKFQQAISTFENMIELYPSSRRVADAHFYMGYCYEQIEKDDLAFQQYRFVTDHFDSNLVVFRKSANRAMLIAKKIIEQSES